MRNMHIFALTQKDHILAQNMNDNMDSTIVAIMNQNMFCETNIFTKSNSRLNFKMFDKHEHLVFNI